MSSDSIGNGSAEGAGDRLNQRLLAAHANGDLRALSELYQEAADAAEYEGDQDRAAFFLTHAWVFALDADLPSAERARAQLVAWKRDV